MGMESYHGFDSEDGAENIEPRMSRQQILDGYRDNAQRMSALFEARDEYDAPTFAGKYAEIEQARQTLDAAADANPPEFAGEPDASFTGNMTLDRMRAVLGEMEATMRGTERGHALGYALMRFRPYKDIERPERGFQRVEFNSVHEAGTALLGFFGCATAHPHSPDSLRALSEKDYETITDNADRAIDYLRSYQGPGAFVPDPKPTPASEPALTRQELDSLHRVASELVRKGQVAVAHAMRRAAQLAQLTEKPTPASERTGDPQAAYVQYRFNGPGRDDASVSRAFQAGCDAAPRSAAPLVYGEAVGHAANAYMDGLPPEKGDDGLPAKFRWCDLFEVMHRAALPAPNRMAMQEWTLDCSVMMQSVMMSAIRGMDGLPKLHPAKMLIRFYRRSILLSAFDQAPIDNAYSPQGGDFTGPSLMVNNFDHLDKGQYRKQGDVVLSKTDWIPVSRWIEAMRHIADNFIRARDEMPLHYFTHAMHAFHIVAVFHPVPEIAAFWREVYERMVHTLHAYPEPDDAMKLRLSDDPKAWMDRNDPAGSCQT